MKFKKVPFTAGVTPIPEDAKLVLNVSGKEAAYVGPGFGPDGVFHMFVVNPTSNSPQAVFSTSGAFVFNEKIESISMLVPIKTKEVFYGIMKEFSDLAGCHRTTNAYDSKEQLFMSTIVGGEEAFRKVYHVVSSAIEVEG